MSITTSPVDTRNRCRGSGANQVEQITPIERFRRMMKASRELHDVSQALFCQKSKKAKCLPRVVERASPARRLPYLKVMLHNYRLHKP